MLRTLVLSLLATALLSGAANAQTRYDPDIQMRALLHNGDPRGAGLYVPSTYRAGQPAPLIIALHGRFSSPKAFHAQSGLAAVAEARGAIVLYPEAWDGVWNGGGYALLNRPDAPPDDLGFINSAIEALSADYAIDRARISVVGFDSGGGLAYALACQGQVPLSGVAVVSALMWDFSRSNCANARPTPMLIVHGRRDDQAPTRGGDVPGTTAVRLSAEETVDVWRRVNGCGERAGASGREDSAIYTQCSSGSPVAYVGVAGGAHDWFHIGDGYELNRQGVDATSLVNAFLFERASFALPQARSAGGRSRSWIVYAPSTYDPARPTPVVVLLHGRPGNGAGMAYMTGMNGVAENNNFIVVYPEGIDNEWNAQFDLSASAVSLTGRSSTLPQDDVGFLQTLMSDLAVDFNIDRSRLYLGGFSNGGFMTYRMACSAGDTFAAFAAVSGNLYVELTRHCQRSDPTPILIMNGTGDPSVAYEGVLRANPEGGEPIRISIGTQDAVALLARRNGCELAGTTTQFAERGESPGTRVVRFVPRNCDAGKDIMLYMIDGGGHTWPGHPRLQAEMGATNMDMDAGEVIWDFFSAHKLTPPRS